MRKILDYLASDHHTCEAWRSTTEAAVTQKDWDAAHESLRGFEAAVLAHLTREEHVLFPALEAHNADAQGLVPVMHMEHRQLRELLHDMAQALSDGHHSRCLRLSEMFNALMQQHKVKEEAWLLPLLDRMPGDKRDALLAAMQAVGREDDVVRGSP